MGTRLHTVVVCNNLLILTFGKKISCWFHTWPNIVVACFVFLLVFCHCFVIVLLLLLLLLLLLCIATNWHSWLPTSCCSVDKNSIRRCLPGFVTGHDPHFILSPGIKILHNCCGHITPHVHNVSVTFSLFCLPHLHSKPVHRSNNEYPSSTFSGQGPGQCDIPLIGTVNNLHIGWRSREIWMELVPLITE